MDEATILLGLGPHGGFRMMLCGALEVHEKATAAELEDGWYQVTVEEFMEAMTKLICR